MSKEAFKEFVRTKPELARYVKNNNTTWQKLYEIYELYGENSSVWDSYLKDNNIINEIVSTIKNVDLEKLQSGIENIQSTISLIQNFNSPTSNNNSYQERYRYQKMDD